MIIRIFFENLNPAQQKVVYFLWLQMLSVLGCLWWHPLHYILLKRDKKKYISQKQKSKKTGSWFPNKRILNKMICWHEKKRERKKIKIPRSGFDNWKWFCTVRKKTGSPFYNLCPLESVWNWIYILLQFSYQMLDFHNNVECLASNLRVPKVFTLFFPEVSCLC